MKKPHNVSATAAVAIAAAAAPGAADILNPGKGKNYLETLDISAQDRKDFPSGRSNDYQWDVMEFAEMSQHSE
jgi:hypothetical protein